jgi:hypothetical protein
MHNIAPKNARKGFKSGFKVKLQSILVGVFIGLSRLNFHSLLMGKTQGKIQG